MRWRRAARIFHGVTFAIGAVSVLVQLILVVLGISVLTTEGAPSLGVRVARFFGYFTVQSNLIAAGVAWSLTRRPDRDGAFWRVARVDGVIAMTITAVVHWFLLRPLLDLHGLAWLTDKGLHVVAPLLIVLGVVIFGPRQRVDLRSLLLALLWPIAWLVVILLQARATGWYPYPFLDVGTQGAATVLVTCLVITGFFLVLEALLWLLDRRARSTGRPGRDRAGDNSDAGRTTAAGEPAPGPDLAP